jgi:hypothetical protein
MPWAQASWDWIRMTADDLSLLEELSGCETAVWLALVDGDAAADMAALDASFLGVYPSGFADKADHAGQLDDGPTVASFTLMDLRVKALGHDHAILSYRARYCRPAQSEEDMYVSSVWLRKGDGWVNVFSQDTPAHS